MSSFYILFACINVERWTLFVCMFSVICYILLSKCFVQKGCNLFDWIHVCIFEIRLLKIKLSELCFIIFDLFAYNKENENSWFNTHIIFLIQIRARNENVLNRIAYFYKNSRIWFALKILFAFFFLKGSENSNLHFLESSENSNLICLFGNIFYCLPRKVVEILILFAYFRSSNWLPERLLILYPNFRRYLQHCLCLVCLCVLGLLALAFLL